MFLCAEAAFVQTEDCARRDPRLHLPVLEPAECFMTSEVVNLRVTASIAVMPLFRYAGTARPTVCALVQ
jgi:hypothetical protein